MPMHATACEWLSFCVMTLLATAYSVAGFPFVKQCVMRRAVFTYAFSSRTYDFPRPPLCRATEDLVPPADARSDLIVLRLGVARGVEVRKRGEERATVPHGVALTLVGDDFDVDARRLERMKSEERTVT
jgi:hypothetical protein